MATVKGRKMGPSPRHHGAKGQMVQEIRDEWNLILSALVAVLGLYITRSHWFPSSTIEAWVSPPCTMDVALNSRGALEGPWLNDTWLREDLEVRGAMSKDALVKQGKLIALFPNGDDGRVKSDHLEEGMAALSPPSAEEAFIRTAFARLAERYLATWLRIDGVKQGLGKRGIIKTRALKAMAKNAKLDPCIAHVRVINGAVFFRYGSFLESPRKLQRINLSIRTIQLAVQRYGLHSLKTEFYLNACDAPQAYDNSLSAGKSGFAVFSAQHTPGSTDILCPDPLDLLDLPAPSSAHTPWSQRESKAVWRGEGLEFDLKATNWASSFRVRLHRMTDVRPDLLDARITMWGPLDRGEAKAILVKNGVLLGARMDKGRQRSMFKYALVVDERVGTRDMCSALLGPQAAIRHASGYKQYFDPLILPGVHYIPVRHSLSDLFPVVEWMKQNDAAVRQMVHSANKIAPLICSLEGHMHFWAVLLAKYTARAMEAPEDVETPSVCPEGKAIVGAEWANAKSPSTCKHPVNAPCSDFCVKDKDEKEWTWLSGQVVANLPL